MTTHFMRSYSLLAIQTCHRREAHAMGGMAAQIPIKGDSQANAAALHKVREDKEREASDGHDGTWVAHPGLVPIALEAFNARMPGPNQRDRLRDDVKVTARDLLSVPTGAITDQGLRTNVNVGLRYLESWLGGSGCVPIFNLMEDAATCEISRAQIWQWIKHPRGVLDDGRKVTSELFRNVMAEELEKIRADLGPEAFRRGRFDRARVVFDRVATAEPFVDFLTLPAYEELP
jgi:malate synthase